MKITDVTITSMKITVFKNTLIIISVRTPYKTTQYYTVHTLSKESGSWFLADPSSEYAALSNRAR